MAGNIAECTAAAGKFLLMTTVGPWSHWGLIDKVEVYLPAPILQNITIVVCN